MRNLIVCAGSVVALMAVSAAVAADDDFPIAGTYMQNAKCKGDGTDQTDLLVKITRKEIESSMGFCAILHVRREGKAIGLQVECKIPSGHVILGDVIFTPRDEGTLDFEDQDHTSSAVLYRCGQ